MRYEKNIDSREGREIPTIRCDGCDQLLSLYGVEIKKGKVKDSVICPNCQTDHKNFDLDINFNKKANEAYLE